MKCPIINNSDYDMESHRDLVHSLFSHANQELGFKKPPTLIFQSDPRNYGALAKTAQYDPSSQEITIYVDGRHIKDILRSFAHELVHHHQNETGRLSGANVTQGEQDFDDIEGDAYYTGNLKLFRKWEDKLKQSNPTIYNERRIYKMSTKKWKNKELSKLMTEKYGFKMDLRKLNEQKEQLDEGSCSESEMEEGSCKDGPHEGMDEGKDQDCPKCKKAKEDCECPDKKDDKKEVMDEEKQFANDDSLDGDKDGKPKWADPDDPANKGESKDDEDEDEKESGEKKKFKPKKGEVPPQFKKKEGLKEHKIWNDVGFKMDLNKLLK